MALAGYFLPYLKGVRPFAKDHGLPGPLDEGLS
jgi:hypothetical protein